MLDDRLMRAMFGESRSIAIIGAKDKAGQVVDRVGRYLLEQPAYLLARDKISRFIRY